jgi:NADPH:quinone reductase-like Zn-dependent oxidoreductase
MSDVTSTDFLVRRDGLTKTKIAQTPVPVPGNGEVLFKVARFGFSANNITYAVMGEMMSYWNFFPTEEGWGRVPVWGFGEVIASDVEGIAPGERFYGYWPMSTHYLAKVGKVDEGGFVEVSPSRVDLPAAYNRYVRLANDPGYREEKEAEHMLLQPLFMTSFLIDDFLAEEKVFGASAVLIGSASSKTAIALAYLLAQRGGVEVVGLTSRSNAGFVEGLGFYSTVVAYEDIASLDAGTRVTYVDMSGDGDIRAAVHTHFGDNLAYDCAVGLTHYDKMAAPDGLPGPAPQLFFAPDHAKKRVGEWGAMGLQSRVGEAWLAFVDSARNWMDVSTARGPDEVKAVYLDMLVGKTDPRTGFDLSLYD